MPLLPTLCWDCNRVLLAPVGALVDGRTECRVCSGSARVVPGASFNANDRALFDELSQVVAESSVRPFEAAGLAQELNEVCGPAPTVRCSKARRAAAGIAAVQAAAGNRSGAQRRALYMMNLIFDTLATARTSPLRSGSSVTAGLAVTSTKA